MSKTNKPTTLAIKAATLVLCRHQRPRRPIHPIGRARIGSPLCPCRKSSAKSRAVAYRLAGYRQQRHARPWPAVRAPRARPISANVHNPDKSGQALARLVLDPAMENVSGRYFEGPREIRSSAESYDEAKAAALRDQSTELVGLKHDEVLRRAGAAAPP
jgi:hypothetical protein